MTRGRRAALLLSGILVCSTMLAGRAIGAEVSVGIYDAAMDVAKPMKVSGGKGIGEPISKEPDIAVSYTGRIGLREMVKFDVFIIPPADMSPQTLRQYAAHVRAYVGAGGNVILTYIYIRACPSICEFRGESWFWRGLKTRKWLGQPPPALTPVGRHPVLEGIERFEPVHKHFILSVPGKDGKVVLQDQWGRAFATIGRFGFGKLLAIGSGLGKAGEPWPKDPDVALTGPELRLILNAVRWMGKRAQPDSKHAVALLQQKAEAARTALDRQAAKLTVLSGRLRRFRPQAAALSNAQAFIKNSKATLQDILSSATKDIRAAEDPGLPLSRALLSLIELQRRLRKQYLENCVALLDARRKAMLADKVPFGRKFPRFPRGFYHPEATLSNLPRDDLLATSGFLSEMVEEAHANFITSAAQRYEANAKWVAPEHLHNFFLLCELYGIAALPCYHFGILDRGWKGAEDPLSEYAKYPAFAGLMIDEPKYTPYHGAWGSGNPDATADFRRYLKSRFTRNQLKSYGVEDPDAVSIASIAEAKRNQFIWAVVGQYSRETIGSWMGRDMSFVRSLGRGLVATMDLQGLGYPVWYATLAPLGGRYICCEPYDRSSFKQVYVSELLRGCTGGKVWKFMAPSLRYAYHNEAEYRRGMHQAMAHNDGIGVFLYAWVAKRMTSWSGSRKAWQPTFWPITCEMFRRMEKLEDYLADTESCAQVAILVSERSIWNNHFGAPFDRELQTLLASLCMANHVPTDFIFLDLLTEPRTKERLMRFKILIAPLADSMTHEDADVIRNWVERGGVLIAAAGVSVCDKYGIQRKDYALADVLGVRFVEKRALEAKASMTAKKGALLSTAIEYTPAARGPRGYDAVRPAAGAVVQAHWGEGGDAPAILTHRFGKGAAAFVSASYPGMGCKPIGTLLGDLINWGLAQGQTKRSLVLENCPSSVDATVRVAQGGNTLVLHLTSYGGEVSGVKGRVRVPWSAAQVEVKDLMRNVPLKGDIHGDYVCFDIPGFAIHAMTAISRHR